MTTQEHHRPGQLPETEPVSTVHILMVDDEPDLEDMVNLRLRREIHSGKYQFIFATDGQDALEKLERAKHIDMVVTDLNMPRMDGIELLQTLASSQPALKSIVVSAYGDLRNIRNAMNNGAFDFVTKPLDFEDLQKTIQKTTEHIAQQRAYEKHRNRLRDLDSQLSLAASIQNSILPTHFPAGPDYDTHGRMNPAHNVSGDFFDFFHLGNGLVALAIADVADKGIPASLYMMATKSLIRATAAALVQPSEVLTQVNNLLSTDNATTMFVTLIYAVYNPATGELTYANAGHCNPALISPQGQATYLPHTNGVALGLQEELEYGQLTRRIPQGHTLIAVTDGVTEAEDPDRNHLGEDALATIFQDNPPQSAADAISRTMQAVTDFSQAHTPKDDATCIALHRT